MTSLLVALALVHNIVRWACILTLVELAFSLMLEDLFVGYYFFAPIVLETARYLEFVELFFKHSVNRMQIYVASERTLIFLLQPVFDALVAKCVLANSTFYWLNQNLETDLAGEIIV